ncbi:hypothetical protein KI659_10930 [Litoribacter alkaliphilus]|uniref:Signal transduction histidine kinase dimerisation/phosphoacceptor domain-containing protein n=1 Tax=Litoribacter ruber TaxID=702568 RepID=A0AAP2CIX3_9BACT|nr:hypothetical protein [Litoribacter alkaliphilus]MBS9524529.1 hypothetical protein [Litoribacter alkaliphilus]
MKIDEFIYYKVQFEAINRLSVQLAAINEKIKIVEVLGQQLKYLFNFYSFEYLFIHGNEYNLYSISNQENNYTTGPISEDLLAMMGDGVYEVPSLNSVLDENGNIVEERKWLFNTGSNKSLITLKSVETNPFSIKSIPLVKLVHELISAKLLNLGLLAELGKKNGEITKLNREQEEVIRQRTSSLKQSNQKLKELIQFNSHEIREPLSRILSLTVVKGDVDSGTFDEVFWPELMTAVRDLDYSLKAVLEKVDEQV